jgi:hypothetical protein
VHDGAARAAQRFDRAADELFARLRRAIMVTSSGNSFCSMRSRTVWKSVSEADGKPDLDFLDAHRAQVLNSRFLVSRLMGSNSAWLPSRRSVLHHTGTVVSLRDGHCRFGRSTGGYGRYFFEGPSTWLLLCWTCT